jgi:hypothetical protein
VLGYRLEVAQQLPGAIKDAAKPRTIATPLWFGGGAIALL